MDMLSRVFRTGELVDCGAVRPGLFVFVERPRADARDYRRCAVCGDVFGFGPIGRRATDGALVHFVFNCKKG